MSEKYRNDSNEKDTGLPHYVDCNNEHIDVCDFFMTQKCKSTCAYALDINGTEAKEVRRGEKYVCSWFPCPTAKETGRDCSATAFQDCRTRRFYNQYGEEPLAPGAALYPGLLKMIRQANIARDLANE